MSPENAPASSSRAGRLPPYSEEAERGVLGCLLLDSERILDLCLEAQVSEEAFYVPSHRIVFDAARQIRERGGAADVLTVTDRLKATGQLDGIGGAAFLDRLVDSTPTAAHADYYVDIVRQKHLLRSVINCARLAENNCYDTERSADEILAEAEQAFLDITEEQHGVAIRWSDAVKQTMAHIETILATRHPVSGLPTGFENLDSKLLGLRSGEMIVLAARPSMGKTSLAMNIAENIALGRGSDHEPHAVGIFSLEMSADALVLRLLCCMAEVSGFKLAGGSAGSQVAHQRLTRAASLLTKAAIYLDDTGGLDILELRARARRMKKKHGVELIIVDYLQLLHSSEQARQGRQIETAHISGQLKAMAKELKVPVLVVSQLSRAPDQRDKSGTPKLSDLRDSGAIEQDADVVCLLRRPTMYRDDDQSGDKTLAIVDVAKQRNGPTGEVNLNFEEEFTRFRDRIEHGVDGLVAATAAGGGAEEDDR
jgi:replicative DNA helicase